jgi:Flp pilus assembly protein TadG
MPGGAPAYEEVCTVVNKTARRSAAATVELALLLPFLAFLFVIAVDWSRIFYFSMVVTSSARNGALYACDPVSRPTSPYANVTAAALAEATNLSPAPTVTSTSGTDTSGPYVEVTVSYQFNTVTNFPGVPASTNLVRTVRMRSLPVKPN